ncbi:MAG: winged helix-turn-helix domain-containing protein [Vicinamibacterales bacterium]|nr:winged helix-turn-helix domain-containing protein [Vicinamibacterales bacterium]
MKPADLDSPRVYLFGDFRLDADRRRLEKAGQPVPLTPKIFDTLLFLVEHRGRVLTKDELLTALWPDVAVEENNLGQAISKLRQVLGEAPGDNRFIVTVSGQGYRFAADVTAAAPAASVQVASDAAPGRRTRAWAVAAIGAAAAALVAFAVSFSFRTADDAGALAPPRTLAVLPFKPLVSGTRNEALEFGMADSLIGRLGHLRDLTVRPLAAVRRFGDPTEDPLAAGRELGVDAILDGHIHRDEDRIRVTVRLVRVADERQLWAGQFDEPLTGIFSIQDAISERITRELAVQLSAEESASVTRSPTTNPAAYEAYLRGRFFISLAQPRNAIEMFEQAVQLDRGFARAHAGLADTLSRVPIATDASPREPMMRARAAALEALRLDDRLGEAYTALGWVAFYYDWDWAASERQFRRALELDPLDFSARLGYAHLLSNTGRAEEAITQVDQALAADPLSPLAGTLRGQFLFHAGRVDEAAGQLRGLIETNPGFWIAHSVLGQLQLDARQIEEAIASFQKAGGGGGVWAPLALEGHAHAVAGDPGRAQAILGMLTRTEHAAAPPSLVALVHLGLGDRLQALTWLERAYAEKDVRMVFLGVDPAWVPLRREPRFEALLTRMGLRR